MARGWESKSIEAQQDDASRAPGPARAPLTESERHRLERRRELELARARATDELARAVQHAHRALLERTLAAIDTELRAIGDDRQGS